MFDCHQSVTLHWWWLAQSVPNCGHCSSKWQRTPTTRNSRNKGDMIFEMVRTGSLHRLRVVCCWNSCGPLESEGVCFGKLLIEAINSWVFGPVPMAEWGGESKRLTANPLTDCGSAKKMGEKKIDHNDDDGLQRLSPGESPHLFSPERIESQNLSIFVASHNCSKM